jgi:hypothetical protein
MKIDPGLPRHPKTRKLARRLSVGTGEAVVYLLNLWGHCQQAKSVDGVLRLDAEDLATACDAPDNQDPDDLERALIESRWLTREGETVTVLGWVKHNGSLIQRWKAGRSGGRPPKENRPAPEKQPDKNRAETGRLSGDEPSDKPSVEPPDQPGTNRPGGLIGFDLTGQDMTAAAQHGSAAVRVVFDPETGAAAAGDLSIEGWGDAARIAGIPQDLRPGVAEMCLAHGALSFEERRVALDQLAAKLGSKSPPHSPLGLLRSILDGGEFTPNERTVKRRRAELDAAFREWLVGLDKPTLDALGDAFGASVSVRDELKNNGTFRDDPRGSPCVETRRAMLAVWDEIKPRQEALA